MWIYFLTNRPLCVYSSRLAFIWVFVTSAANRLLLSCITQKNFWFALNMRIKDIFKCLQILLFLFSQDESYTPTPNEPLLVVVPPQGNQRILAFNLNILLFTVLAKKEQQLFLLFSNRWLYFCCCLFYICSIAIEMRILRLRCVFKEFSRKYK
jgi:hypothetical protein